MESAKTLTVEQVPLGALCLDPANTRTHSERNLEAIKGSLARFGQQKPIVVDHDGVIRAGNGTYEAAKALGWESILIVRTDLQGLEAAAYAIADNRTTDLSEFDDSALAQLLAELRAEDALAGVGFDEDEIDALLAELEGNEPTDITATRRRSREGNHEAPDFQVQGWTKKRRRAGGPRCRPPSPSPAPPLPGTRRWPGT